MENPYRNGVILDILRVTDPAPFLPHHGRKNGQFSAMQRKRAQNDAIAYM
jgi:hypothetical protein